MRRLTTLLLCLLAVAGSGQAAAAGTPLVVGAAEDAVKQPDLAVAKTKMDLARLAGFSAVRVTAPWTLAKRTLEGWDLVTLRNAAIAADLAGIRLYVAVYPSGSGWTPLTAFSRARFAEYAASIARELPTVRDFIIGNEPNLNRFWMPQFTRRGRDAAAPAYEMLLARTYLALKEVSPEITVIGGTVSSRGSDDPRAKRPTHSPTQFIRDLGAVYRARGRTHPIMDAFVLHPYLDSARQSPAYRHERSSSIGIGDYDKLRRLLAQAFDGTPQAGSTLPILYGEFGVQTAIGPRKLRVYTNRTKTARAGTVPEALQARAYREALTLASCQPNVIGLLFFHVSDERDLARWQSGLFYADDTPKSSLPAVRAAVQAAVAGTLVDCTSFVRG